MEARKKRNGRRRKKSDARCQNVNESDLVGVAGRKAKANCKRWWGENQEGLRMGLRNSVIHQKGASVTEKEKKNEKEQMKNSKLSLNSQNGDSKKVRLFFELIKKTSFSRI